MFNKVIDISQNLDDRHEAVVDKRSKGWMKTALVGAGLVGGLGFVYKTQFHKTESEPIEMQDDSVQSLMDFQSDRNEMEYTTTMVNMDCPAAQSSHPGDQRYLPNLQTLAQGYNIYKGDPTAQQDGGFAGKVFAFNWNTGAQIYFKDTKFFFPAELSVMYAPMCSSKTTTTVMKDERQFQESAKSEVTIGGSGSYSGVTASFKASAGYHSASDSFNSGETGQCKATAECQMYRAQTGAIPPCPSEELMLTLEHLMDENPTAQQMNDFYDQFGTHSLKQVAMGARFVATSSYDKQDKANMDSSGYDLAFEAKAGGFGYSASGSASHSNDQVEKAKNSQSHTNTQTYTMGTMLPAGNTVADQLQSWVAAKDDIAAAPVSMGKIEIQDLPSVLRLSLKIRKQLTDAHDKKLTALATHLNQAGYCNHLKDRGELDNCDLPPNRQNPGPIKPSVKLLYRDESYYKAEWVYNDDGSGADWDFSVWKPSVPKEMNEKCFSLGHYAVRGHQTPTAVNRYCTEAEDVGRVFARPRSLTRRWADSGSGGDHDGALYNPNCPQGFVALSAVGSNSYGADPDMFPDFRCLAQDLAVQTTLGGLIWKDSGSGAKETSQVYSINGSEYWWNKDDLPVYRFKSMPIIG